MKRVLPVLLWAALSSCVFAQVHRAPRSVPNAPGVIVDPGFGSRMAATVAGRPVPVATRGGRGYTGGHGYWNGGHGSTGAHGVGHPRHSNTVVVPYPVVVGGGYGYGYYDNGFYDSGPAQSDTGAYYQDPNAQQPPVVIINQNFRPETVNPVVRDYSNTPLPPAPDQSGLKTYENPTHPYADALERSQPQQQTQAAAQADDEKPTIYLLAFKDRTIIPALAYWVDGDTLNYITKNGIQNRASLSLIDKDFSKELNDQRHVEFKLPGQ
ncbi:MAG: hypothetical protein ACRD9L_25155 [Bryobacteraceae bacterium]